MRQRKLVLALSDSSAERELGHIIKYGAFCLNSELRWAFGILRAIGSVSLNVTCNDVVIKKFLIYLFIFLIYLKTRLEFML